MTVTNQYVQTGAGNVVPVVEPGMFRNSFFNGNFDIWQRGTTAVGAGAYFADRFRTTSGVESGSQGTTTPPTGSKYYAILTRTTASSGNLSLTQRVESANMLKYAGGKSATLSFKVRQTSGSAIPISVIVEYAASGVDDFTTVATDVARATVLASATSDWQTVTYTFTVGTNSVTNGMQVAIGHNTVTGPVTINIAQVQLEPGTAATPFEFRPYGVELALCQRYYYKIFPGVVSKIFGSGANYSTTKNSCAIKFPVTMRVTPTSIETSGTANHFAIDQPGVGDTVCSAIPAHSTRTTTEIALIVGTTASGLTQYYPGNLVADATNGASAYLAWSAEL